MSTKASPIGPAFISWASQLPQPTVIELDPIEGWRAWDAAVRESDAQSQQVQPRAEHAATPMC